MTEQTDRALALLQELVTIETPSRDAEASARIARVLQRHFTEVGGEVTLHEGELGTHLVAEFPGVGEPVLLIGHSDTVWPVGTLEERVPWVVDGDTVRGPGVYDMKGGIVVMLEALRREGCRRAVRVVVVCDEEIGSPTSQELVRECARGVRAALGFEAPTGEGAFKLSRRGSVRVRLAVEGVSAHAAIDPDKGVSAIDELVDQLQRVRDYVAREDLQPVLCNVGTISGGTRANVVADRAEAELGLRFVSAETEQQVLGWLDALEPIREGATVTTQLLSHRPTWELNDGTRALVAELQALGHGLGQQLDAVAAPGAGDTNLVGNLGIPTLDGLGPAGAGAHAVHEQASLASLNERIELLAAYLASE